MNSLDQQEYQHHQNSSCFERFCSFCSNINLCLQPQLSSESLTELQQQHKYLSLYKDPYYGECHAVQSRRDGKKYVVVKESLNNPDYKKRIDRIQQIRMVSEGSSTKNIIKAEIIQDMQKTGFLWTKRQVYFRFEYILVDLEKQFRHRISQGIQFSQLQIKKIVKECVEGFLRLQLNKYNSIRMNHIYFCDDGRQIKLAHPKMFNYRSNLLEIYENYNNPRNIYLSPEEIHALKTGNQNYQCGWISNSFTFGMTILSLMTMKKLKHVYDYRNCIIDFQEIKSLLEISKNRFSSSLTSIVQLLLKEKQYQRLSFRNLYNKLDVFRQDIDVELTLLNNQFDTKRQYENYPVSNKNNKENQYPNYLANLVKPKVGITGEYMNISNAERPNVFDEQAVVANTRLRYSKNQRQQIGTYSGDTVFKQRIEVSQTVREGKGLYQYVDGQAYLGDWKDGKMHGYGKLYYKNKKLRYEGSFKQGLFQGNGTQYQQYQIKDREDEIDKQYVKIFKGNWVKYQGNYIRDKKQGAGKVYFSRGFWRGNFKNNQPNGQGIYQSFEDNTKTRGVWQDGELIQQL